MNYKNYINSRDKAWRLLIDCNIVELPVKIVKLCADLKITVKGYVSANDDDGYSCMIGGKPYIFVNNKAYEPRQRFTVAHELGHILLGHVGKYELVNREPTLNDNPIEHAANIFASRLLAPACVLWGCGVKSADDIARLCCISKQAAEFRMERMDVLYKRDKFLTSPLERQVYEQFESFISQNKL